MPEPALAPQTSIFNFNAYSPPEIEEAIEKVGVTKAKLPFIPCFMLGIVAGAASASVRSTSLSSPATRI